MKLETPPRFPAPRIGGTRFTSALCVALMLATSLHAQSRRKPEPPRRRAQKAEISASDLIERYDEDGDGRLSRDELRRFQGNPYAFDVLDRNHDGEVSRGELRARIRDGRLELPPLPRLVPLEIRIETVDVTAFDADRDGRLSKREFRDWMFAVADQTGDGRLDVVEVGFLARADPFRKRFHGRGADLLKRYDRTRDGLLTRSEFKLDDEVFDSFDADGDGRLSSVELAPRSDDPLAALAARSVDQLLDRFDRDGDGALSAGEFPGGGKRGGFGRVDSDHDGKVTRDELGRELEKLREAQFATLSPSFVERFDANGDGRVSPREFPGDPALFRRLDRNGDGFVGRSDAKGRRRP